MKHKSMYMMALSALLMMALNMGVLATDTAYVVGVQNLENPFAYTNVDGDLAGISIDFLGLLAQQGGYAFEIVEITDETKDMDFDFTLLLNNDQAVDTWRSDAYLSIPVMLLEKEHTQAEMMRVGVLGYYDLSEADVKACLGDQVVVVEYENSQQLTQAFVDGDIYRMMITTTSMTFSRDALAEVHYLSTPLDLNVDLAMTFAADFDPATAAAMNDDIAQIGEAELQMSVIRNSAAPVEQPSIGTYLWQHPELMVALVAVILLIVLHGELRGNKRLKQLVNRDDLTKLYSKHRFIELMEQQFKTHPEGDYTLLSLDIDDFKYINEIYGYKKGNQVLVRLAEIMSRDTKDEDLICRVFADKFLVFTQTKDFEEFNRMYALKNATEHFGLFDDLLGENYAITISVGVYQIEDHTLPIESMIDCADLGRSQGKNLGESKMVRFSEEMIHARSFNSSLVAGMEYGLVAKEFTMYYQPKVQLSTGAIYGAEALVRWNKGGVWIQPNDFITLFEHNGFIQKLDYYIFDAVCSFLKQHGHEILPPISINLSAVTVVKPTVVEDLMEILNRHGVVPSQIDIEMTETALVEAHESALAALTRLRELGFTCSMDDFGVGVSSLTRLKNLPIDTLKIDRGLVLGHMENEKGASILRNIFRMAKDLKVHTVAEGVETEEHLKFLMEYGCEIGQGFYFSRPLPELGFIELCRQFKEEGKLLMPLEHWD